jgi:hypothetical protein
MSNIYWWKKKEKGRLGTMYELQKAINLLSKKLSKSEIENVGLRSLLLEKSELYNKRGSEYAKKLIPGL